MTNERFVELLSDASPDSQPHSYSGRFMYGRKCVAITTDSPYGMIARVMAQSVDESVDDATEEMHDLIRIFDHTKQDAMGLSIVIYWPNIEWQKKWDETDEEDEEDDPDLNELCTCGHTKFRHDDTRSYECLDCECKDFQYKE